MKKYKWANKIKWLIMQDDIEYNYLLKEYWNDVKKFKEIFSMIWIYVLV